MAPTAVRLWNPLLQTRLWLYLPSDWDTSWHARRRWDFWQTITHVQRSSIVYQVSRGQVARSRSSPSPPRDPCRYGIGKILCVLTDRRKEARAHSFKEIQNCGQVKKKKKELYYAGLNRHWFSWQLCTPLSPLSWNDLDLYFLLELADQSLIIQAIKPQILHCKCLEGLEQVLNANRQWRYIQERTKQTIKTVQFWLWLKVGLCPGVCLWWITTCLFDCLL